MCQIDWARLWYCVMVCRTSFEALSMSLVAAVVEMRREKSRFWASSRASLVALSPSW